jgi:hypothetical protein
MLTMELRMANKFWACSPLNFEHTMLLWCPLKYRYSIKISNRIMPTYLNSRNCRNFEPELCLCLGLVLFLMISRFYHWFFCHLCCYILQVAGFWFGIYRVNEIEAEEVKIEVAKGETRTAEYISKCLLLVEQSTLNLKYIEWTLNSSLKHWAISVLSIRFSDLRFLLVHTEVVGF